MVNKFFLVFAYPSFELVDEPVDRSVHVLFSVIAINCTAIYFRGCLGFMPKLLNGQDTLDVRNQVKMSCNLLNFRFDIFSKRISNFDVMS